MVRIIGKVRSFDNKSNIKVNENFKTEAEARKFLRIFPKSDRDNLKVVRLKKKGSSGGSYGGSFIKIPRSMIPKIKFRYY